MTKNNNNNNNNRKGGMTVIQLLVRLVSIIVVFHDVATGTADATDSIPRSFPYLYATIDNYTASFPVVEYIHPDHYYDDDYDDEMSNDNIRNNNDHNHQLPDFLFMNTTNTNTYRIVEFYVHWCDVCKNFKPQYIQLGRRINDLVRHSATATVSSTQQPATTSSFNSSESIVPVIPPNVEVYAVSCAPNRDLCRLLGIDQYPFFRIYRPSDCSSSSSSSGNSCSSDGIDIPHAKINPTTIVQQMGIPLQEMRDDFDDIATLPSKPTYMNSSSSSSRHDERKYERLHSRDEVRDDIHRSFDYAMRYAVFVEKEIDMPLSEERAIILNEWLHVLQKTIPISYTTLRTCIKSLIDQFDYVKRSEAFMISILEESPPPNREVWSGSCSYGIMDNGYTCGLWLLLHTVTIGMVDYNRNVVFSRHRITAIDVADTIRNYIHTFFQCEICRHHFVTMYDNCSYNRCIRLRSDIFNSNEKAWIELPLWLLEIHNDVNVRLLKEQRQRENEALVKSVSTSTTTTDDDDDIIHSVLWPLQRDCPKCWIYDDAHIYNSNNMNVDIDIDGTTRATVVQRKNDETMYKYLKVVYGQRDAVSLQYQEEIQADIV